MPRLIVELDTDLYRMLQEAARINQLSLQEECVRRLVGGATLTLDGGPARRFARR